MEPNSFEEFNLRFDEQQEKQKQERLDKLDDEFPLQDRVIALEKAKSDEWLADRRAELETYEESPLLSLKERINLDDNDSDIRIKSGYKSLDKIIGGFRLGNTYVVGGLEKSGKSSFLLNIFNQIIKDNIKAGYINSELTDLEWVTAIAAINADKPKAEIEQNKIHRKLWLEAFEDKYYYAGINDNVLDFNKAKELIEKFGLAGAKAIIIDNLTTYQTISDDSKAAWEVLAKCISDIVALAKRLKIVVFCVIHTKPSTVFNETAGGIKKMIEEDPRKLLRESLTITKKPSLADMYGGGRALSQVSGALLIWRPYQKFDSEDYKKISLLILDSFRHASSGKEIEMDFHGDKGIFTDLYGDLPEPEYRERRFKDE